jgi:F0F1-type ATP synthase assembly protein I
VNRKNPNNRQSAQKNTSKHSDNLAEAYRKVGPYLNIGVVWMASVLLFTWIGITLDKKWDTKPWLTLTGAILGIITGFYHFIKTVMSQKNSDL